MCDVCVRMGSAICRAQDIRASTFAGQTCPEAPHRQCFRHIVRALQYAVKSNETIRAGSRTVNPYRLCIWVRSATSHYATHCGESGVYLRWREVTTAVAVPQPTSGNCSKMDENGLRQRLEELRLEHRDLDDVIARLQEDPYVDQLQLTRMKKRKLWLKDMIAKIESKLTPDIIA